jgi:hypothetical protein
MIDLLQILIGWTFVGSVLAILVSEDADCLEKDIAMALFAGPIWWLVAAACTGYCAVREDLADYHRERGL